MMRGAISFRHDCTSIIFIGVILIKDGVEIFSQCWFLISSKVSKHINSHFL